MPVTYSHNTMRLAEMMAPNQWVQAGPRHAGKTGLGQASGPVFLDLNGNKITSIVCGGSYTFAILGSSTNQVYLIQNKNGVNVWQGTFNIPMPKYTSSCERDVGYYLTSVYDLRTGQLIGSASFTVLPSDGTTPPPPPPGTTPPVPGTTLPTDGTGIMDWFNNMSTTGKLAVAGVALLVLTGGKRR